MKTVYLSIYLIALICLVSIAGCLNDNGARFSSTIRIGLEIDEFDSTMVSGNDTLQVERVRFIYGDGAAVVNGDTSSVLSVPADWLQFGVSQNTGNFIPMFRANPGTYSSFVFSVQNAPVDNTNIDPDFTEETEHSLIIEGKYNGLEFTYKSDRAFKVPLEFIPPIEVPDYNESYVFLITTSTRFWFNKFGGGFHNPAVSEDSTAIINNIENSFAIEANRTNTF